MIQDKETPVWLEQHFPVREDSPEKAGLPYTNSRGLLKLIESIPSQATWHSLLFFLRDSPEDKHVVHYRDPLEAIKALLRDPALAKHIVCKPKCIFTDVTKEKRVYDEMWTSSWWEETQAKLPEGSCVAPVIIAMDKTQLTQFSGGQQAYPVYLTLGNIPSCMLIVFLPVEKFIGHNLSKVAQLVRMHRVFHKSMRLLLEPLIKAGSEGIEIVGGDRHAHTVHPILACYIANYLEQCLDTCCKFGKCPKCLQKQSALGDWEPGELREQVNTLSTIH
ncbi:hypothetical protein EDC04DRAFT_2870713 [Pisolithus marmoratus]|nr:hypothetical protein EDC04DRAFT_2870713 [Pisolithus marmoratus]